MGLNPASGPDFIATYLDDVLILSPSFEEHLIHLQRVLDRLIEIGLKLKPTKFRFICQNVEYLGHVITPEGISPKFSEASSSKIKIKISSSMLYLKFCKWYHFLRQGRLCRMPTSKKKFTNYTTIGQLKCYIV